MSERKIIQISAIPVGSDEEIALHALCDDGSLWLQIAGGAYKASWEKLDPIPQPTDTENE